MLLKHKAHMEHVLLHSLGSDREIHIQLIPVEDKQGKKAPTLILKRHLEFGK